MGKFGGLMKNEYIKILKKTSTKIMIILLALSCFGIAALAKKVVYMDYSESFSEVKKSLKDDIEYEKKGKLDGWENRVKFDQFIVDDIKDEKDWRYKEAYENSELDIGTLSAEDADKFITVLKNNDVKAYNEMMSSFAPTKWEKWAYDYRVKNNIGYDEKDENVNKVINQKAASEEMVEQLELVRSNDNNAKEKLEKEKNKLAVLEYQLKNKQYENAANYENLMSDESEDDDSSDRLNGFWSAFFMSSSAMQFVGIMMIVIAGGIVASEFSKGTIKFLLINPTKRWKILMSKYLTCVTFTYILAVIVFLVSIPAVGIINSFDGISMPYIYADDGVIKTMSPFLAVAKKYLISSVNAIVMMTLAFAISSLVRSSSLAIGVGVASYIGGNIVVGVLTKLQQDWARYLIFTNMDLDSISSGVTMFPGQSVSFAVTVIAVHMVVFILTAWDGFTKRSV